MKKADSNARAMVDFWLDHMEEGDSVKFSKGFLTIHNAEGCELDRVEL